jgi:zinc D-Ala-D-Ala dipeptidase
MKYSMLFLLLLSAFCSAQPVPDTAFVNLKDYSSDFVLDLKYATQDNFLETPVYNCGECLLRFATVKALLKSSELASKKGFRIKIFDCYRPLSVQKKMWQIVPNPLYVADPAKGSIHNRGGAVDLTLIDKSGNELEMGTAFDHFGPESAHNFKVSAKALHNRKLLRTIMEKAGFTVFESEWWHYNVKGASVFPLSDEHWHCD